MATQTPEQEFEQAVGGSQPQVANASAESEFESVIKQPKKQAKATEEKPSIFGEERLGPVIGAIDKYAVQPFEKLAKKGSELGSKVGKEYLAAASGGGSALAPVPSKKPLTVEEEEKQHPVASGVASGLGGLVGGTVGDIRNWPFFLMGGGAVMPLLNRLISGGFGVQMGAGAAKGAKELYQNWDKLTTEQRAELATSTGLATVMAGLSATHAVSGEKSSVQGLDKKEAIEPPPATSGAAQGEVLAPPPQAAKPAVEPQAPIEAETITPPPEAPISEPEWPAEYRNAPKTLDAKAGGGANYSADDLAELKKKYGISESAAQAPEVPGSVREVPTKDIVADPKRFQFRSAMSESGLSETETYNPSLAGIISVWKDPETGDTNVVNGHHRLDLAKRAGEGKVLVRYLDAADAKDARAQGALINIAEGNATGIDAAKFFRDTGISADALKAKGLSLGAKAARDGMALSKLSDGIFDRVVDGDVPVGRAVVIGQELPDMADQTAILQLIESKGKQGVRLTDDEVRELARFVKQAGQTTETQETLFGEESITKSNAIEKAQLSAWIKKQLARDKKLFGFVAKSERAKELARAGNIIDVEKSGEVASAARASEEVYSRLLDRKGPVSDAIQQGAARIAKGEDLNAVRKDTYERINTAVSEAFRGAEGQVSGGAEASPAGEAEVVPMGEMRLRDILKSHPNMGPLADDLVDAAGIVTQNAVGMPLDEFLKKHWSDIRMEGEPSPAALNQDDALRSWLKRSGRGIGVREIGEQLSMFGEPEKAYMLRNKKGQEAMVLQTQLDHLKEEFPHIGEQLTEGGEVKQGGLFGENEETLFGPGEDDEPKLLFQEENPIWYTKSENILANPALAPVQSGSQWEAYLRNQGVKADEMKWLGIDDFLKDKRKVTKADLMQFIRENQLEVKELTRGTSNPNPSWNEVGTGHSYASYTLPGDKKNYTELLLTLPDRPNRYSSNFGQWLIDGGYDVENLSERDQQGLRQIWQQQMKESAPPGFTTSHFPGVKNILAHVRFDERTDVDGNRVLFVEEVQSDWHQKGKKVGYNVPTADYSEGFRQEKTVPDAPFKTDWHEMAMKRMLREAAERGFDKIAWVTGEQTADRYDLSKKISAIGYSGTNLKAYDLDGNEVISRTGVRSEDLPDLIGKDAAQKLMEQTPQGTLRTLEGLDLKTGGEWAKNLYDKAIPNFLSKYGKKWGAKTSESELLTGRNVWNGRAYEGPENLIAVESIANRTRRPMPSAAAQMAADAVLEQLDRGKSFHEAMAVAGNDVLAEEIGGKLSLPRVESDRVHSLDITPEMKQSVMAGQPLFQGKKGATEFLNDGKAIVYLFKNADASTFLHEFVHTLEPYLKGEDRSVIDKWLDDEDVKSPVARKEALARAFEEFHTNGEAPTSAIQAVFQRIQEIMRKIYEAIKDSPLVKPSKEVEDLFRRWYGGEPEKLSLEQEFQSMFEGEPLDAEVVKNLFESEDYPVPPIDAEPKSDVLAEKFGIPPGMEVPGPGGKNVNTIRETPADIIQLRDSLRYVTSPNAGMAERLKIADKLSSTISKNTDAMTGSWNKVKTNFAAMWNAYWNPLPWTDFRDMLGKWQGADQKAENDAYQFAKAIRKQVPDKLRREAIYNYVEADGDPDTLLSWYLRSEGKYKEGYRVALELNESEKILAANIRNYYDSRLQAAIDGGMLEQGVKDYVNRILKNPDKIPAVKKLLGEIAVGKLQTNPRFAKKRIFETSFEAEAAGFEHVNKDIGFTVTAYDLSFNKGLSARSFIKSLLSGRALDGRSIVAITGSGKQLDVGDVGPEAYVIRPTVLPEETGDYRVVDHPALRKWKWASEDINGAPIYVQGDLAVHPEAYQQLKNVLGRSWLRDHWPTRMALQSMGELKATKLSLSLFHEVQIREHALFHLVNPAFVPEIDWENPTQRKLIDHGLQVVNHHALEEFSDGVGGTGLLKHIPVLGPKLTAYNERLFGDVIPRLKMKMAVGAFEKNMSRYAKDIESGKLNVDQVLAFSANQANAAFGEQNYKMLARNPSFQDAMRLFLLAPDFLESRAKVVGQAVRPYGREQAYALMRNAAFVYGTARVVNMIANNGDPKWDSPFSVVIDGKEYSTRSIVGDLYHLWQDPRGFAMWRVNPFTTAPTMELLTGRDRFGRKQSTKDWAIEQAKGIEPIPTSEGFDAGVNYLKKVAPGLPLDWFYAKPDANIWKGFLESVGIHESAFRSPAADLARKKYIDSLPSNLSHEQLYHSHLMHELGKDYHDGKLSTEQLAQYVAENKITQDDVKTIVSKRGGYDEMERDLSHLPADEGMEVWRLMNNDERRKYADMIITKIHHSRKLGAAKKQELTSEVVGEMEHLPPSDRISPPPAH